jgi:glutathione synthase/RimK-type ligase-like ATP-grasp enzyme
MKKIIVVNNPKNFNLNLNDVEIISSKDYLTRPELAELKNIRVFNLANEYKYQSRGYYVSLLAEARGHKPIPKIKNIQDIKSSNKIRFISDDLDELIQNNLKNIKSKEFELSIYFGQNIAKHYEKLCHELHLVFQAPFLRAKFVFQKKWVMTNIRPISFNEIPEHHLSFVREFAIEYFGRKRYHSAKEDKHIYDLAILIDPTEKAPPSDKKALTRFVEAADKKGFSTEFITKNDFNRIGEFDALFIRATTNVNHHTYRFSRKAQSEGLIVIDDPESILKCTNKVYLAEILSQAKIPTPKTIIVHSENKDTLSLSLGLPCVLKLPDSSFSHGVIKANTRDELKEQVNKMLEESDLLIAQEFIPTDFDWRIGFIDGKALFACKYFMARGHWQIYNWNCKQKNNVIGNSKGIALNDVPTDILKTAQKAVKLIGNGFYGVDLKEVNGKPYIIEINDNPSIDAGVEDVIIKEELYNKIMDVFLQRIEQKYPK